MSRYALTTVFLTSLALFGTVACGGGEDVSSAPAPAADGLTQVPLIDGLRMKVPENAKPNRGAAGFYTDDKSWGVMIREEKSAQTMEQAKTSAEEMLFKSWITSEATDDGWIFTYESVMFDMDGNEAPAFAFQVAKTLEGTQYTCSGSLKDKAGLDACVDSCKTLKKG